MNALIDHNQLDHLRDRKTDAGGFPCPKCNHKAAVQRSHVYWAALSRWRTHQCICGYRFSTCQVIAEAPPGLWNFFNTRASRRQAPKQEQPHAPA